MEHDEKIFISAIDFRQASDSI